MRDLLSNLQARPAATRWLRAGILVLLLATYAALAAPTTGAEPGQTSGAHAAVVTVHIAEGNGGDTLARLRKFDDPSMPGTLGVHAWAG